MKKILLIISLILFSNSSFASRGGLDKDGCHTDKETKKYHCHNKKDKKDKKNKKNRKNKGIRIKRVQSPSQVVKKIIDAERTSQNNVPLPNNE